MDKEENLFIKKLNGLGDFCTMLGTIIHNRLCSNNNENGLVGFALYLDNDLLKRHLETVFLKNSASLMNQ